MSTSRMRYGAFSTTKASKFSLECSCCESVDDRETRSRFPCVLRQASNKLMAVTSWSQLGAFRTPPELVLRRPALNWTGVATSASMADWRQVRRMYGQSENAPAVHNSRIYPK